MSIGKEGSDGYMLKTQMGFGFNCIERSHKGWLD